MGHSLRAGQTWIRVNTKAGAALFINKIRKLEKIAPSRRVMVTVDRSTITQRTRSDFEMYVGLEQALEMTRRAVLVRDADEVVGGFYALALCGELDRVHSANDLKNLLIRKENLVPKARS